TRASHVSDHNESEVKQAQICLVSIGRCLGHLALRLLKKVMTYDSQPPLNASRLIYASASSDPAGDFLLIHDTFPAVLPADECWPSAMCPPPPHLTISDLIVARQD